MKYSASPSPSMSMPTSSRFRRMLMAVCERVCLRVWMLCLLKDDDGVARRGFLFCPSLALRVYVCDPLTRSE